MHWKPGKKTVALDEPPVRISRIRRDPVRVPSEAELKKAEVRKRDLEMWGGITGVGLYAVALFVVVIGIAVATVFRDDPDAEARARHFGQCYNAFGPNCVIDGNTIRVRGLTVNIAGVAAPRIQGASCEAERSRGVDAAVRLASFLNSGPVSLGAPFADAQGRQVRPVQVGDRDVGNAMVTMGIARTSDAGETRWCG